MNQIVIIGGGHAGVEASLAIARLKQHCTLVTLNDNSIGRMSCNPAIGGLAKGHLVREIDALGGVMGEAADQTSIQFKTLNKSKGRAVWSPRAQVDKLEYASFIQNKIKESNYIKVVAGEVVDIVVNNYAVEGCLLSDGSKINCSCVIITTGTFLNGKIHIGNRCFNAGRFGELPSNKLTNSIVEMGFDTHRLKTGTPPRLLSKSIDWSKLETSMGDTNPDFFSIRTQDNFQIRNTPCYVAYTNKKTHVVLKENLDLSPMFSGKIDAIGPRYCPSVEDKVVRFSDKDQHQLFLEPEWNKSKQIYLNGFSTSLPEKTQLEALRTIRGLENVELIRPGYAIEYDYFPSRQLKSTMESKHIKGLFFAGQLNGTSGYEEAAAQGLIAGINSVFSITTGKMFTVSRSDGYIGVLIDDLITKNINEPYRMFTSRAEHRLHLRQDNADIRLTPKAIDNNITTKKHITIFNSYYKIYKNSKKLLKKNSITVNKKTISFWEHLKNNNTQIQDIKIPGLTSNKKILITLESESKYEGYIKIQNRKIEKIKELEKTTIPPNTLYCDIHNLSSEAIEKLTKIKPETLGQASRIDGVRQSDIATLTFFIHKST